MDPAQLDADPAGEDLSGFIRSKTLDAKWSGEETEMDRLIRGAYLGRLTADSATPSKPGAPRPSLSQTSSSTNAELPPPIIRIHSECYTGETIGSMRCDCGEQLDEAIRYISQPQTIFVPPSIPSSSKPGRSLVAKTVPGRGAVIYLRQEGRGIGLLEKIRAYNLQDMGHDTVAANILLGHGADERRYDVAAAIMRDLGLGNTKDAGEQEGSHGAVRILTNNPDKVDSLRKEGIIIKDRLPMIPRSWAAAVADHHSSFSHHGPASANSTLPSTPLPEGMNSPRKSGATMIGGGAVSGLDLDRYLRTKVLKMGHLLELPTLDKPQPNVEIVVPSPLSATPTPSDGTKVESLSPTNPLRPLPTSSNAQI